MYPFFETLTTAKKLWYYKGHDVPLTREGNIFTAIRDGVEYTCTLTDEGEVTLRRDTMRNTTDQPITVIPIQSNFHMIGNEFEVYTQYNISLFESSGQWQPLMTRIEASCGSLRSANGAAPFLAIWDQQGNRGMAFHLLTDGAWELAATRRHPGGVKSYVYINSGLQDNPPVTLQPGETLALPTMLFYDIRNKLDLDAWKLHRWFHTYHPRKELPVLYNTWLYKFDNFTPEQIESQIPVAAELGIEYFVVDAGWFGEKGKWSQTVGDWEETPTSAMEGRLGDISRQVREQGMKFGLWLEIERASTATKIYAQHPEYFVPSKYNPQIVLLNFAVPEACQYLHRTIDGLIEKYNIEFIKFDFNTDQDYIEDDPAHLKYFKGYRKFIDELAQHHPDVYLGNCASGGHRVDINNALQFNSYWLSDNQSPLFTMRIFKDTSRRLVPQAIERWITIHDCPDFPQGHSKYGSGKIMGNFDSGWSNTLSLKPSWMDGFMAGGPMGFSCDLTSFSPELREQMKRNIAELKENREYWNHVECRLLCDTPRLLVLEYTDKDFDRVVLTAFMPVMQQDAAMVYPVVDTDAQYMLDDVLYSGKDLDRYGLKLPFTSSMSAVRLCLTKVK